MNRYARMKRASKSNGGKKQFVDNQKKVVRGVLLLIISTLHELMNERPSQDLINVCVQYQQLMEV